MELYGQQFDLDNPKSTFFHGDCLEGMKAFPDGYFDMILTDPPYNTTHNDWDVKVDLDNLFEQFNRIIKDNGAVLVFSQLPFTAEIVMANRKYFRYEWIWDKASGTGFLNANRMPMKTHENIIVFYKTLPTYNPQFTWGGGGVYTKIIMPLVKIMENIIKSLLYLMEEDIQKILLSLIIQRKLI